MKISIVTPCFNTGKYIAETIESVLSQKGDFELEYIIVDGGSTDGTIDTIKKYEKEVSSRHASRVNLYRVSEPDKGMYDAINKGFSMASGDIFAWINSDDIYYPEAFKKVTEVFNKYDDIMWLAANSNTISENSEVVKKGKCLFYNREWLQKGFYGYVAPFVEQETVFFRKELWQRVGKFDINYKLAGDYWLWMQFAKFEELYSLDFLTSAFRQRKGQLSGDKERYRREMDNIKQENYFIEFFVKIFFKFEGHFSLKITNIIFRVFNAKSKAVNNDLNRYVTYNHRR